MSYLIRSKLLRDLDRITRNWQNNNEKSDNQRRFYLNSTFKNIPYWMKKLKQLRKMDLCSHSFPAGGNCSECGMTYSFYNQRTENKKSIYKKPTVLSR